MKIDITTGIIIGMVIGVSIVIVIYEIALNEIANQFCETKGLELVNRKILIRGFDWIDCQESKIVKTNGHTFSWE